MRRDEQRPGDEAGSFHYGEPYGYGNYGYGYGYGERDHTPSRSFKDYLLILRERFMWLVVIVFTCFLAAWVYTFNSTPLFRAVAAVQVLRQQDQLTQFTEVVDTSVRNSEDLNTQIRILQSANIAKRVYERIRADDMEHRRFMAPYDKSSGYSGLSMSPLALLQRNRDVQPVRMSLLVYIQYVHPDPGLAARVANLFAEEFINYNLALRIEGSMKAVDELKLRADQQRDKVEEIEHQLADFKEKHHSVSFDASSDIDQQELLRLNEMLTVDKRILDESETQWRLTGEFRSEGRDLWDLAFIASAHQVGELLAQRSGITIQLAQLGKRYRDKHPKMIEVRKAFEEIESELIKAVNSGTQKVNTNYRRAKENFRNSQARIERKKNEIINLQKFRVDYHSMLRNLNVNQEMFQYFYTRMQQAMTQATDEAQAARVVDRAFPPSRPFKPNVMLNLGFGLTCGIILGVAAIFLLAVVDDKVKTAFDIETAIGLVLIGLIPRIKKLSDAEKSRAVADGNDNQTVEAFRGIHSLLRLNEESRKAKCILTTSTVPGEGKSFISSNIAFTFALHGEKTILIDADLRMPTVAKLVGVASDRGLVDFLNDDAALEDIVCRDHFPNLDVLPTGGKARNSTELLSGVKFEGLIHELRLRYDKIIIDTPPLAPVSDALGILPLVDGVLYVLRFNAVKRRTAKLNVRRIWEANVPVFGAVLNNIRSSVAGYYYSHYYDRSYQDYYLAAPSEEKEKPPEPVETGSSIPR